MRAIVLLLPAALLAMPAHAHEAEGDTVRLDELIEEALDNSPELEAAHQSMAMANARAEGEGTLPSPELIVMREGMPAFRYNQAMFNRIELMQMIPFPTKLAKSREIAGIAAEHAHHDHMEKVFDLLLRLKSAYAELWYLQKSIGLNRENARLIARLSEIARTRYASGEAGLQEALKWDIEAEKSANDGRSLRERELAVKAMIMAILDRSDSDTLGTAILSDTARMLIPLATILSRALEYRPMIQHDSLNVVENKAVLDQAEQEFIPDLRIGLQYMNGPLTGFNGWTVTAAVTLPFAPWSFGAHSSRVEESEAAVERSEALLASSRAMLGQTIREHYYRAREERERYVTYQNRILPQAERSLQAALGEYQTGKIDFLMLLDSYRMQVDLSMESLMARMEFEQDVARLEGDVGVRDLSHLH